mmetsp:Transcript_13951/g.27895  ORF Transcript_13951/g.27895 Transcript_13951/m.27895 type:complete len:100 (-) Transcript_13951:93-392(-)
MRSLSPGSRWNDASLQKEMRRWWIEVSVQKALPATGAKSSTLKSCSTWSVHSAGVDKDQAQDKVAPRRAAKPSRPTNYRAARGWVFLPPGLLAFTVVTV